MELILTENVPGDIRANAKTRNAYMKNAISFLAAVLIAASAQAEDAGKFYGRIDTGYSASVNMKRDVGTDAGNSAIIGAGIGYHINDHIRTDLTLGYRGGYNASGAILVGATPVGMSADINSTVGLVNAYYDIGRFDRFTPYVGAGVGFSSNRVDTTNISIGGASVGNIGGDTHTSFAWQVSAGTGIELTQNLSLDVGYRFIDMGTAQTGDTAVVGGTTITGATIKGNLRANELQAGLRWTF